MILVDGEIKSYIHAGWLKVEPYKEENVQPASLDCTLAPGYLTIDLIQEQGCISCDTPIKYKKWDTDEILIGPKEFVLATTVEEIELPGILTAFVEGRSSIGRMGLFIQNAGWIDPGFRGQITLELFNASPCPIKLFAGQRICQLVFSKSSAHVVNKYAGKYVGQKGAVGSRVHEDREFSKT